MSVDSRPTVDQRMGQRGGRRIGWIRFVTIAGHMEKFREQLLKGTNKFQEFDPVKPSCTWNF